MKYNTIVVDYDGTLLRSDWTIADSTIEVINRLREKGGTFMVSTGRAVGAILPILQKLGLTGEVACCQGSVVCDIETGTIKYCDGYPVEKAAELCKRLEDDGLTILYFTNGDPIANKSTYYLEYYNKHAGTDTPCLNGSIYEYVRNNGGVMNKICTLQSPEETNRLYEKYRGTIPGIAVNISEPYILEFADVRFNKGTSLDQIRKTLPDPNSKIISMGDSLIDIPLLQAADLGVAVGNARQEVKDVADLITVTNDDNAVEYIIRNYMLGEKE